MMSWIIMVNQTSCDLYQLYSQIYVAPQQVSFWEKKSESASVMMDIKYWYWCLRPVLECVAAQ